MKVPIPCLCPPKADGTPRHAEGDSVTLRDRLDFRTRLTLRQTLKWANTQDPDATEGQIFATLTEAYLLHCIDAWTLADEKGKAVPPTKTNIRGLLLDNEPYPDAAMTVANAADGLYSETVLLPLLLGASNSSATTRTPTPTSLPKNGRTPHPRRSKPSSTSTTQMAATGPMQASPAGVSN